MAVHLNTHSYFSLLEGLESPRQLVEVAAHYEMLALAITDHNRLSGAIEFYDACREIGILPLIGMEVDYQPPTEQFFKPPRGASRLVLLAENLQGWSSLCRLASILQSEPSHVTPLQPHHLAEFNTGLLCLAGGAGIFPNQLVGAAGEDRLTGIVDWFQQLFPDRLYLQIQRQSSSDIARERLMLKTARCAGIPLVAAQGIYYLSEGQTDLQRTVSAIRLNTNRTRLVESDVAPRDAHFRAPQEFLGIFKDIPEAVMNIEEVVSRCKLDLPLGIPHFPKVEVPNGMTPIQALRMKSVQGAERLYASDSQVMERLEHELDVIESYGYEALFLVMEQIVDFAHQSGIPIASRDSASSSLVAHCLGITTPDPVRLNLYFERFLNPARTNPPDIDTDLCSRRRDEVVRFVYQHFGIDRVATVGTVNRFRRRSALREVAKAFGLPLTQVNQLAENLPSRWYGPPDRVQSLEKPFADLESRYPGSLYQEIFSHAAQLIGVPRHLSVHPGGVVVSPGPINDLVPTQMATKGVLITQFDLESIERTGLVKIDLLGIRGLTVLGDVATAVTCNGPVELKEKPGVNFEPDLKTPVFIHAHRGIELLDSIQDGDLATAAAVEHGRTIGCFQIESPGMRSTLKEIHARSVDDVMAALALYRPGPLTGGLKDAFVARFRGQELVSYAHPALQPLLSESFGVILYQEQVLRIAHDIAGFSLADADLLRRAMSHFDPATQMELLRDRFIAGALQHSQVSERIAVRIWEQMAAFAGYGFPKAHAASYAKVAWQSAWLKTHYPALFMAAVLANWGGYYSQRVYLTEARRLGLTIRPPHINYSSAEFAVRFVETEPILFMGLNQVRELTQRTQARIQKSRPFRSLMDFVTRVDPRSVEVGNLVRAGSLDGLGSIPGLLSQLKQRTWRTGQMPLFELDASDEPDWSLQEKAAAQEQVLGVSVTIHPLELFSVEIASAGAITTVDAAARIGQHVRVAGARQNWRRGRSSVGGHIYFMSLEDLEGMLDVVIPREIYRRDHPNVTGTGPYLVEGRIELDPEKGEPLLRAERIMSLV